MRLTEHFTTEELEFSQNAIRLGIVNHIPTELYENAKQLCEYMEWVREILGHPITVTSGYRSPELNAKTPGSSKTSAHSFALAMDFTCPGFGTPYQIVEKIINSTLSFDQCIYEGTWVHISPISQTGQIRNQVLTAKFVDGHPVHHPGLVR